MIVEKCITLQNTDNIGILWKCIVERLILVALSCCISGKKMVTF